jgi:hypothetical protein
MTNILRIGGDLVRWGDAGAKVAPEPDGHGWTVPDATPAYVVLQELEGGRDIGELIDDLEGGQFLGGDPEALAFARECAAAGVDLTPVEHLTEMEVRLALDDLDPDNPIAIEVARLIGLYTRNFEAHVAARGEIPADILRRRGDTPIEEISMQLTSEALREEAA